MGEMLTGLPLFAGQTSIDQLVEIIRIRGTPTNEEVLAMNQEYVEFKFPSVTPQTWDEVFEGREKDDLTECCDLMNKLLQYSPVNRITCFEALAHPFFNELRNSDVKLPNGQDLPPLFDFSKEELEKMEKLKLTDILLPQKKK
jgi:serine/threonine protein kinase